MERLTIKRKIIVSPWLYDSGASEMELTNRLGKLEDLEEEIGCPLEVRCNLDLNDIIFDQFGTTYIVRSIGKKDFVAYDTKKLENNVFYRQLFLWKEYKVTWWLKEDRSE